MIKNLVKRQDLPCYERGNGSPFCFPTSKDVWLNGTRHEFVWNYQYPFYVSYEKISIYLYYKERFAYQTLKNWTNIPRSTGVLDVQVDDTWFPSRLAPGSANKTWTLYGFYLPAGLDPAAELVDTASQYPRPFNFSVVQTAYSKEYEFTSGASKGLSSWAIAVIAVGLAAAIAMLAISLIWLISNHRRRKHRELAPSRSIATFENPLAEKMESPSVRSSTPIMHEDGVSSTSRLPTYADWAEEEQRKKLGEERLKRQLEEEGTMLKNAQQRQTRIFITSNTAEFQRNP